MKIISSTDSAGAARRLPQAPAASDRGRPQSGSRSKAGASGLEESIPAADVSSKGKARASTARHSASVSRAEPSAVPPTENRASTSPSTRRRSCGAHPGQEGAAGTEAPPSQCSAAAQRILRIEKHDIVAAAARWHDPLAHQLHPARMRTRSRSRSASRARMR